GLEALGRELSQDGTNGMTTKRRYSTRFIRGLIGSAVVMAIAFAFWPWHWEIVGSDGSKQCVVSSGQSRSEVVAICGVPTRVGDQPNCRVGRGSVLHRANCGAVSCSFTTVMQGSQRSLHSHLITKDVCSSRKVGLSRS